MQESSLTRPKLSVVPKCQKTLGMRLSIRVLPYIQRADRPWAPTMRPYRPSIDLLHSGHNPADCHVLAADRGMLFPMHCAVPNMTLDRLVRPGGLLERVSRTAAARGGRHVRGKAAGERASERAGGEDTFSYFYIYLLSPARRKEGRRNNTAQLMWLPRQV